MNIDPYLAKIACQQPYPLVFVSLGGPHLYGTSSAGTPFDLRGAHVLPAEAVLGLYPRRNTVKRSGRENGLTYALVTHDITRYMTLLLRRNGAVLDQIFSPLVVVTSPEHEELKETARASLSRAHARYYSGLAQSQWKLFNRTCPRRVKPLLNVYRVLLTGIYLMQSGQVESNLRVLNTYLRLPYLPDLMEMHRSGQRGGLLEEERFDFYQSEYDRLLSKLETAALASRLPASADVMPQVNDLLIRIRTQGTVQA